MPLIFFTKFTIIKDKKINIEYKYKGKEKNETYK